MQNKSFPRKHHISFVISLNQSINRLSTVPRFARAFLTCALAFGAFSLLLPLLAVVPLVRVVAAVEGEVNLLPLADVARVGLPRQRLRLAVLTIHTPEWQFLQAVQF